ncbi:MAG: trimethylamine methyltransferase family protein [Rhodobacteraceae bacterium]|nr:trimethylamine methyltransferase family protein [Paracoccaceae bacterium]
MAQEGARRRGRRRPDRQGEDSIGAQTRLDGGRMAVLGPQDVQRIDAAARDILARVGMSDAPAEVVELVVGAGGQMSPDGRLLFPPRLLDRALKGIGRGVVLHGRAPGHDLHLTGRRVHVGTGGAAPMIVDLDSGRFRASTLADLYDTARLVERLDHVHFFARPVVAGDMPDDLALDVNTAYAALAGTQKHVIVSATDPVSVQVITRMCHRVAGSEAAFRAAPFLSLTVNHVVPPLRFSPDAALVLVEAARAGIPMQANTFGQLGASSPVTIAGCVAQTVAETLAGAVVAWLAAPDARIVFGPRPMVTDLRTGGMAGGCGEQALLTAAAVQMAQHYGLSNSTIAGATDSKTVDAQAGFEKAVAVGMAAQTGANLITQACGMLAGLMACSHEAYVADNDMLGVILRTLAPIDTGEDALSVEAIDRAVRGEGHFLGEADTYRRMKTDFLYPDLSDRRTPEDWERAGAPDMRQLAHARAREILASHFPAFLPEDLDSALRAEFDIRLPKSRMTAP